LKQEIAWILITTCLCTSRSLLGYSINDFMDLRMQGNPSLIQKGSNQLWVPWTMSNQRSALETSSGGQHWQFCHRRQISLTTITLQWEMPIISLQDSQINWTMWLPPPSGSNSLSPQSSPSIHWRHSCTQ
jgi:hypothetical protein